MKERFLLVAILVVTTATLGIMIVLYHKAKPLIEHVQTLTAPGTILGNLFK